MKHHYKKITTLAPTVLLAAALASCGGGGGGGSTVAGTTYQSIVTTAPPSPGTYTGEAIAVLDQLTLIRSGAGYLTPKTSLNTAASKHVTFLSNNNLLNALYIPNYLTTTYSGILGGHYESNPLPNTVASTDFYGISPQVRATTAGYVGTVSEMMTYGATDGTNCVDLLGDSVFHAINLISPFVDLGISFIAAGGANTSACAIEVGVANNTLGQLPANAPVVYPYDLQTGVLPTFYNQAEIPVAAPDLDPAGHPVLVSLYTLTANTLNASAIKINTFSITPNGGVPLTDVRVLVSSGGVTTSGPALTVDSNIPRPGFVVLVPEAPLDPNQLYDVSFSATITGHPSVAKNWSFTTGPAN
jgi:hypothetical protein